MINLWSPEPRWGGSLPGLYSYAFSLDRLTPGVDNINIDVLLSPDFSKAISDYSFLTLVRHANVAAILKISTAEISVVKGEFNRLCRIILLEAVNRAKQEGVEPQIDFLAQTAIVKLLIEGARTQFDRLQNKFNTIIWEYEMSRRQDMTDSVKLKEALSVVRRDKKALVGQTCKDLLACLSEVQQGELKKIRDVNFGAAVMPPDDLFVNPLLYMGEFPDDFFMLQEYVLLGRRSEDANTFVSVLGLVRETLGAIEFSDTVVKKNAGTPAAIRQSGAGNAYPGDSEQLIDGWIKAPETFNVFLNFPGTQKRLRDAKDERKDRDKIQALKRQLREQKNIAGYFYRRFRKTGLLDTIVASCEMQSIYSQYCPPLSPQELLQYLTVPRSRKKIVVHLKRLRRYYGKRFSLSALRKTTGKIRRLGAGKRKEHLLNYLNSFGRYFRDLENYRVMKEAMGRLNLVVDERIISLSRANHTLYEFLLPHEDLFRLEEKPITSHVIIKTDVRGATTITRQLQERGLNTASYFSLNFFEPIFGILPEYGAMKVFIEGDAIILAILEHQNTPAEGYSVARACGLAVSMLKVIRRYNATCIKHKLPVLEVGSGICYQAGSPTYLLDGDNQIMISPAINQADRLSGSSKQLQMRLADLKTPFNLYVFQKETGQELTRDTADDLIIRYNVNGIELSEAGFAKLSSEINLMALDGEIAGVTRDRVKLHTGKVPTVNGRYQRIIIREAVIPLVGADELNLTGNLTAGKYYEVCTDPALYKYVRDRV